MSNYVPSPPSINKSIETAGLTDVLLESQRVFSLNLNCHAVGTVQSFNAEKQSASITLNYQKAFITRNQDGTYSEKVQKYPVLVDVPVIVLSGGQANLTFPIVGGEPCVVLFNDRDLDIWVTSGQVLPPNSARTHDLNDGIALIGVKPFSAAISGYDSTRAVLKNGNAMVGVGTTKVKIANATTTLKTELASLCSKLNSLCAAIQSLTVTCASPGNPSSPPINAANFATLSTEISTISSNISGLLE